MEFTFAAQVWKWQGDAAWHFVALPEDVTDEIEDFPAPRGGFGSVRVLVQIRDTTWRTSIFPDKGRGTFILPVKKPVRGAEGIEDGDTVTITLETLD